VYELNLNLLLNIFGAVELQVALLMSSWMVLADNSSHLTTKSSKLSDINLAPNLNLSFVQNTIEDLI
jgi:hypothetical protein